ncbi:alpha-hydroxy acid oxidase [Pseudooceanicola aestuarii]|uniref:alpha-hydroxy acid oxidase n=1 Tax=Pseudooceanicola aestuarii TaxID=2697319 RepID=UPI0013CF5F3A|nr:alpha-hydroxy acid oxidase [Pseudooceanicola aestuarii]
MNIDFRYPTLSDLRARARRRLPHFAWEYLDSGTGAETAVRRSRAALDAVMLKPRTLRGAVVPDLTTPLMGRSYDAPFGVSPVGMTGLFWPGSEQMLARMAARRNLPFGLSTVAAAAPEDVAPHMGDQGWFQLYPPEDMEQNYDLLRRAKAAGFHTLILTVDVPGNSRRERSRRSGLQTPPRLTPRIAAQCALRPAWSLATLRGGMPRVRALERYNEGTRAGQIGLGRHRAPDPDFLARIRDAWDGPMVAKGVLLPDEALMLRDKGIDAIWVSNHGGRQFDAAPGSATALPAIRAALGPDVPVIYDGAVASGLDVLRAIALGADMVMLGRGWLWGTGALGERGADHVAHILAEDMKSAMVQMAITRPEEVRELLWGE